MRCLVIGSTGLVGKAVFSSFMRDGMETYGTYMNHPVGNLFKTDIRDRNSLRKVFEKSRPDVVVMTSALTWVDYCETHQQETWAINVEGTRNVADLCRKHSSSIVFMSTDYIFDGQNGPYKENAEINPINFYGKTKAEGEKIVTGLETHLIIRTTVVFDYNEPKNFVSRLIDQNKKGMEVKVPNDQYGNPTLASNLSEVVMELVKKGKTGVYNVCGKTWLQRHEFALILAEKLGLDKSLITGVDTEELNQAARRPKKGGLDTAKIQKEARTHLLDVHESIDVFKKKMETGQVARQ